VRAKGVTASVLGQAAIELIVASVCAGTEPPCYGYSVLLAFLEAVGRPSAVFRVQDAQPADDVAGLALAVVASYCPHSEFTRDVPRAVVVFLRAAARQSLEFALGSRFTKPARLLPRVFAIPTTHWKVVLRINRKMQPHNAAALFATKRKAGRFEVKSRTVPNVDALFVDFDPVLAFVDELRSRYGSIASFWYDELGGVAVGVDFDPKLLESRPLLEANLACAKLEEDGQVTPSVDLIVQQMKVIGGDLISSIERRF